MYRWCYTPSIASPLIFILFFRPGRLLMAVIERLAKSVGEEPVSSNRITIRRPNKRRIKLSRSGVYALP